MVCGWFYTIYEIHDMILMTPQRGMLINIYVLYDDSYKGFHLGFMMRVSIWFYGDDMNVLLWVPL